MPALNAPEVLVSSESQTKFLLGLFLMRGAGAGGGVVLVA